MTWLIFQSEPYIEYVGDVLANSEAEAVRIATTKFSGHVGMFAVDAEEFNF